MRAIDHLLDAIDKEGAAALVRLTRVEGSTPREAGAWMVVRRSGGFHGTIGGGALEWNVMRQAHEALTGGGARVVSFSHSLGPDLGQCCGGRAGGEIEIFDASRREELLARKRSTPDEEAATPLLLFGAGHVGRAVVLALASLPFETRWIDQRPEAFPAYTPANVTPVVLASPVAEVAAAPDGAFVLVMTHSHPLDLDIVAVALLEGRFPWVGLIGSDTKRARFETRLRALRVDERAIAALSCPVGVPGILGKAPAVIAASVAAEMLARRSALAAPR